MAIDWDTDRFGGLKLTDKETGETLYLQGDDAASLEAELDAANEIDGGRGELAQNILSEYRACIEIWDPPEEDADD